MLEDHRFHVSLFEYDFCLSKTQDELQLVQAAQNKQHHGHERRLDSCVQQTKQVSPNHIKSEDIVDAKKRDRKDTDEKKDKDHKVILVCDHY